MDRSGKRCLSCGYNGDGHYTHCIEPYREEAKRLWDRMTLDNFKGHDAELLAFVKKVAGIYH
jgi:hypothetical protein